jgi:HPr kinase/phosphorylase
MWSKSSKKKKNLSTDRFSGREKAKAAGIMKKISVESFFQQAKERLHLSPVAEAGMSDRFIVSVDINRMGMALTGYLKWFPYERLQILGKTEIHFLRTLKPAQRKKILKTLLSHRLPCIVVTHKMKPPADLVSEAEARKIPLFSTVTPTTKFVSEISVFLEEEFAPETTIHGTLLDVYGVGILILGNSGIGKSECALDLVERGHRLVADDLVYIKRLANRILMGSRSEIIKHHMEIRGLGIINIESLFGVGAIRDKKRIELIIRLEEWDNKKEYDRLGLTPATHKIFDVEIPMFLIPVRPGRNLAVIIEVAAMNHRLMKLGYFTAQEFADRVSRMMAEETARRNPPKLKGKT